MKLNLTNNEVQMLVNLLGDAEAVEPRAAILSRKILKQSRGERTEEETVSFREFLARARAQSQGA